MVKLGYALEILTILTFIATLVLSFFMYSYAKSDCDVQNKTRLNTGLAFAITSLVVAFIFVIFNSFNFADYSFESAGFFDHISSASGIGLAWSMLSVFFISSSCPEKFVSCTGNHCHAFASMQSAEVVLATFYLFLLIVDITGQIEELFF